MIFLFIVIALCMIFVLQSPLHYRKTDYRNRHRQNVQRVIPNVKRAPELSDQKEKERHNPLFGPFRGTLDEDHVDVIGGEAIKHQEAEAGYVILNGVKRKIEDCKDL